MAPESYKGQWSGGDNNYHLVLNEPDGTEAMDAQNDGLRLTFVVKGIPFVFQRLD